MAMQLQQVVRLLDVENHQLRDEVARLSKMARERSYHARRVRLALDDALLLATWLVAGIHPTRRYARLHGVTQRRWQNALALLRMARVVVRRRRWAVDDLATIERRLTQAAQRAIADTRAYRLHLNRHGTR
jgi:hypothetical protein